MQNDVTKLQNASEAELLSGYDEVQASRIRHGFATMVWAVAGFSGLMAVWLCF